MKLSVLNLAPLRQGQNFKEAMDAMVRLAQKTEELGYERYWIAEHHNAKSIASSATSLLIQHVLSNTETLKVGSGGIMLPNHSPYLVAEEFGTLETLYPNRVQLGLGRAPGTDMETARAIRRTDNLYPKFKEDIAELQSYFEGTAPVHAYPAEGLSVPYYILGSSTDSAYLAAELGLPYAFASHFAPGMMVEAVEIYHRMFKPSKQLEKPYVILGANAILADTDEEAQRLATTQIQSFLGVVTNEQSGLKPPCPEADIWNNYIEATKVPHFGPVAFKEERLIRNEKRIVAEMTSFSFIGSPEAVSGQLERLKDVIQFDELMVNSYIYDEEAQHHSYELLMDIIKNK